MSIDEVSNEVLGSTLRDFIKLKQQKSVALQKLVQMRNKLKAASEALDATINGEENPPLSDYPPTIDCTYAIGEYATVVQGMEETQKILADGGVEVS